MKVIEIPLDAAKLSLESGNTARYPNGAVRRIKTAHAAQVDGKTVAILGWGFAVGQLAKDAIELIRVVGVKSLTPAEDREMLTKSERLAAKLDPARMHRVTYSPANGFVPSGWDVAGKSYSADRAKLFIKYTKGIK